MPLDRLWEYWIDIQSGAGCSRPRSGRLAHLGSFSTSEAAEDVIARLKTMPQYARLNLVVNKSRPSQELPAPSLSRLRQGA